MRNFANKLLLIALLVIVACGQTSFCTVVSVVPMSDEPVVAKTYYFDQYNGNSQTQRSLYEDLGIKVYNDYLTMVNETKALENVVIAVVDSGLNTAHPVFNNRVLSEYARNFSLSNQNTDFTKNWDQDHNGHGTHVAGIIADMTLANVKILPIKIFHSIDNQGSKYAFENAINYICALQSGKVGKLIKQDAVGKIFYENCNQEKKQLNIVAVNLSLGTDGYDVYDSGEMLDFEDDKYGYTDIDGVTYSGYQDVIDRLLRRNIMPIVAAGNYGKDDIKGRAYYSLPGACDGVLAVSAYDNKLSNYKRADFSFYNNFISVAAPGNEIWSACSKEIYDLFTNAKEGENTGEFSLIQKKTDQYGSFVEYNYNYKNSVFVEQMNWIVRQDDQGNFYLRNNGTSMATPFVSACYAMLFSDTSKETAEDYGLPAWDGDEGGNDEHFMNFAHKALLAAAATYGDKGVPGYDEYFGYGIINLASFAQETILALDAIKYEITPSTTFKNEPEDAYGISETNWSEVFYFLLFGVILIWGFNNFRSYLNRRKTHGNDQPE